MIGEENTCIPMNKIILHVLPACLSISYLKYNEQQKDSKTERRRRENEKAGENRKR